MILTVYYFLEGGFCCEYLHVWKSLLVIMVSPSLVCLNFLKFISPNSVCLNCSENFWILLSCVLDCFGFSVLLDLFWYSARSCRASSCFYSILPWIPYRFFSCLVWFIPICRNLNIVATALVSDIFLYLFLSDVYWCGTGRTHMDG